MEEMEEINKYITEALGECVHFIEAADTFPRYHCSKCGLDHDDCIENDFSTWEGFGKLWEWSTKQDWWLDFIRKSTYLDNTPEEIKADIFHLKLGITDFIVPSKFAKAVFLYLIK